MTSTASLTTATPRRVAVYSSINSKVSLYIDKNKFTIFSSDEIDLSDQEGGEPCRIIPPEEQSW